MHSTQVSPQDGCEEHFEILRRSIAERRKVLCGYVRGASRLEKPQDRGLFLFRPYSLYFGQRAWYVIGLSEKRGDVRTLKLNRLRGVKPTDQTYLIPDGWTVENCLGKAWRMIKGDRRYLVRIRFDADHAKNVAETLWHATQEIVFDQADGSSVFKCEVDGLDEIVWWVLGHGPHAEVLAPAELRTLVCDLAERMCTRYRLPAIANAIKPSRVVAALRLPQKMQRA